MCLDSVRPETIFVKQIFASFLRNRTIRIRDKYK